MTLCFEFATEPRIKATKPVMMCVVVEGCPPDVEVYRFQIR